MEEQAQVQAQEVAKQEEQSVEAAIQEKQTRNKSGYWQVPNAYFKKIRQLTLNQVREECIRLAASLVDMRNANHVLMQTREHLLNENKKLQEDLNNLRTAQGAEQSGAVEQNGINNET